MTDDRGAAIRAAIWAKPHELDGYRVYADWLLEQGSSLGTYMQLALVDAPSPEQQHLAKTILDRDRAKWIAAGRNYIRGWTNDRFGFVGAAECSAQQVAPGFDRLLELGPRLRLTVTAMNKRRRSTVREVAAVKLGRFYGLALSTGLDDKDLAALAPALAGITHLDLSYNGFTHVGLRAVGEHVAGIKTLAVISDNFAPDWIEAIVETPGFRSLECVEVFGHDARTQTPTKAMLFGLKAMPEMKRVNPKRAAGTVSIAMDPDEP